MITFHRAALALAAFIATPGLAFAHVSITPTQAANGANATIAIAIPHGCDGAATDAVAVAIPAGFASPQPQAKPGWTVEVTEADNAVVVKWSGGSIPHDQRDEFVLEGLIDTDAEALAFPTIQSCGQAELAWIEQAAPGADPHALEHPAPILAIADASAGHDHMDMSDAVTVGDLEISGAFARATLPNAPVGGGYLTIVNHGNADDRLVSASSPVAGKTEVHEMKMEGDVMRMNELPDGLAIPAGETVSLTPGGLHIMFKDLAQPLVEGTRVPITLNFEKAGTVELELSVEGIAAKEPDAHMHHHGAAELPAIAIARTA